MTNSEDTICAVATPPGRGGVGIVRVSGALAQKIADAIVKKKLPPRNAQYLPFFDHSDEILDQGLAIFFPGPNSFTGEDVLELQGHGGPVILELLLGRVIELGARLARPGEFSERAFLNDKIDLVQAEAIADIIDSSSEQAARAAMRSLRGEFSQKIEALTQKLIELRVYVESAIDFPDEEIDFLTDGKIKQQLENLNQQLEHIIVNAKQGSLLREGMTVVIAGKPNAGKSSLLNKLAQKEAAIVTAIAGTTRDVIKEQILIDGLPIHVLDTAGLRQSDDIVEQMGVDRALHEVENADRVLVVVDDNKNVADELAGILPQLNTKTPLTIIRNKIDISQRSANIVEQNERVEVSLSAQSGEGLDLLRQHLKDCVGYHQAGESNFIARKRHLIALEQASGSIVKGLVQLNDFNAAELLAEELRQAQQSLSEITGEFTSDDLLGEIFSSFCIGK